MVDTSSHREYQQLPITVSGYDIAGNEFVPQPVSVSTAYPGMQIVKITATVDRVYIQPAKGQVVVVDARATVHPVAIQSSRPDMVATVGTPVATVPAGAYGLLVSSSNGWFFVPSDNTGGDVLPYTSIDSHHILAFQPNLSTQGLVPNLADTGEDGNLTLEGVYSATATGLRFIPSQGRGWAKGAGIIKTPRNALALDARIIRTQKDGRLGYIMMQGFGGGYNRFTGPTLALGIDENDRAFVRIALSSTNSRPLIGGNPIPFGEATKIGATYDGSVLSLWVARQRVRQLYFPGLLQNQDSDLWSLNDNGEAANGWNFGLSLSIYEVTVSDIVRPDEYMEAP